MLVRDPSKFLEDLSGRYARRYFASIHEMFVATVEADRGTFAAAKLDLLDTMKSSMGIAEVIGASIALRNAAGVLSDRRERARAEKLSRVARECRASLRELVCFADQDLVPAISFEEAVEDLASRVPVTLRDAAERTAQNIARIYETDHVMAFVRAAEQTVTENAQAFIVRAMRDGYAEGEAGRRLAMSVNQIRQESEPWSEAYARMVFRTNTNSAVTAGRFRQVRDPDVKALLPAFRFDTVGDSNTRPNHQAGDGVTLSVDNVAWGRLAPPVGFSCRCRLVHMTTLDLEMAGLVRADGSMIESRIPLGFHPDAGFRHGGRPDLFLT